MKTATLKTDWHDVPAGTPVEVIRRIKLLGVTDSFEVRRTDGLPLPCGLGVEGDLACIAPEFLSTPA